MAYTTPFGIEALFTALPFSDAGVGPDMLHTFYTDQDALAVEINARIIADTPINTGALRSSEKFSINYDPSDTTLIRFYADSTEQLEAWKRVYVSYQEGEPIGQQTYTNEGHQMYYNNAQGQSVNDLMDWGYTRLQDWVGNYTTEFNRT